MSLALRTRGAQSISLRLTRTPIARWLAAERELTVWTVVARGRNPAAALVATYGKT